MPGSRHKYTCSSSRTTRKVDLIWLKSSKSLKLWFQVMCRTLLRLQEFQISMRIFKANLERLLLHQFRKILLILVRNAKNLYIFQLPRWHHQQISRLLDLLEAEIKRCQHRCQELTSNNNTSRCQVSKVLFKVIKRVNRLKVLHP